MKTFIAAIAGITIICLVSACQSEERYLDLNTGERVDLVKDPATGLMVREDNGKPVEIYVDTETNDTIYGISGKVINGDVVKLDNGKYKYDDGEYKIKDDDADYKMKVDDDGDIKIKDGDTKTKIDGETGEKKVKQDG